MKRAAMIHSKMKRLQRRLELPLFSAAGLLECLWHLAAREAPCGDIGKLTDEDIAWALEWPDDPERLVSALVECGWLDRHPQHRLIVHDWHEHADDAVKKFISRNKLAFVTGQGETMADAGETSPDESIHVATCIDCGETSPPPARVSQKPEARSQKPFNAHARDEAVRVKAEASAPQEQAAELLHAGRNILYRFTGAELTGRQREDALCQLAAHLENGRAIDLDLLERAVGLAETGWRENGDGKRRGVGWVLNALRDLLLEVDGGGGDAVRAPQEDEDERQARRRELIRAGLDDDEGRFNEVTAAWGARLLDFGYSEPAAEAELRRLLLDVRDNVKAIKGARNGKSTGRAGRPDTANAQPADPRS